MFILNSFTLGCGKAQNESPKYLIVKADTSKIADVVSFTGKLRPELTDEIPISDQKIVTKVFFKTGDNVNSGDVIARVEDNALAAKDEDIGNQVNQKKIAMKEAERKSAAALKDYQTQWSLFKKGVIAKQELTSAKRSLASEQSALRAAKADLKYLESKSKKVDIEMSGLDVKATRSGTLDIIYSPDNAVEINAFRISDMSQFEVRLEVSELDIVKLKQGQIAEIKFEAIPRRKFKGEVVSISGRPVDSKLGMGGLARYEVLVRLTEKADLLRIGMSATIEILLAESTGVILPIAAVQYQGEKPFVMIQKDSDSVESRPIEVGIETNTEIEVIKGLAAGEQVAVPMEI